MRRFIFVMGVFLTCPLLGVTTKDEQLAAHVETGGIGESALRWHPFIETEYAYNDNLNFLEQGGQSDHLWIFRPGFSTIWSNRENAYAALMYQLEVEEFLRSTGLDTLNHLVDAKADWNWDPLYLFIHERYLNTNDRSYTTLTQLVQRQDDQQTVTAGWQKSALTFELQGERFQRRFEQPLTEFDSSRYGLSPSASWDWTESQRMIADAGWDRYYYPNDAARSGHSLQSRLGWEFRPSDEFVTRALGGYETRQYDGPLLNDFNGFIGEWMFNLTRFHDRGRFQGAYRAGAQDSIADAVSGHYREHLFQLSFSYGVSSKITPSLSGSWARQIYGNTDAAHGLARRRDDDVATAGMQVRYAFSDRLSFVPAYNFQRRVSNVPSQSYDSRTTTLVCRYAL